MLASIDPKKPCAGVFQFVLHGVAGERGVVSFNIHLHMFGQAVSAEKVDAIGNVIVVLMLGRFLGLRFEVELALEADLPGMIDRHVHEPCEVVELALHVSVPQIHVAFAPAPECVAHAAQRMRHFQGFLYLRRGVCESIGIATGSRAVYVARVAEQVGRSPQQANASAVLFLLEHLGHGVEILMALGERLALGGHVPIVKAVEMHAELFHELKGHAHAILGILKAVLGRFPRAQHRAGAERVLAGAAERVPISHGEAEMFLHRLAFHHLVLVVVMKGEHILALWAFEADLFDIGKCGHDVSLARLRDGNAGASRAKPGFLRRSTGRR